MGKEENDSNFLEVNFIRNVVSNQQNPTMSKKCDIPHRKDEEKKQF